MKYSKKIIILCLTGSLFCEDAPFEKGWFTRNYDKATILISDKNDNSYKYALTHNHPPIVVLDKEGHYKFLKSEWDFFCIRPFGYIGFACIGALLAFIICAFFGEKNDKLR